MFVGIYTGNKVRFVTPGTILFKSESGRVKIPWQNGIGGVDGKRDCRGPLGTPRLITPESLIDWSVFGCQQDGRKDGDEPVYARLRV